MFRKSFDSTARKLRPRIVSRMTAMTGSAADADDIAQETLLRLWMMRDRLESYKSVEALAMVIARNLAIDGIRSARSTIDVDDEVICNTLADSAPSPDSGIITRETESDIDAVLSQLSPGQEAVIRMRHVEGMEIAEIAKLIGSTENNVRVTLCRARARVRQLFTQQNSAAPL